MTYQLVKVLTATASLVCVYALAAIEPLATPTHYPWKNNPPGTWIVFDVSTNSIPPSTHDRQSKYKQVLIGEDATGKVHVLSGECDDSYEFISNPRLTSHPRASRRFSTETLLAEETSLFKSSSSTQTLRHQHFSGISISGAPHIRIQTSLADDPEFDLFSTTEENDEFLGQTYNLKRQSSLDSIEKTELFGRPVLLFHITETVTKNGVLISKSIRVRSPDLPRTMGKTDHFDDLGNLISRSSEYIVAMGFDPDALNETEAQSIYIRDIPLDPNAPPAIAYRSYLLEVGFNDFHINRQLESISITPQGKWLFERLNPLWIAYQTNPSEATLAPLLKEISSAHSPIRNRDALLPSTERLLLEIGQDSHNELALSALKILAGLAPARHASRLEAFMVERQLIDIDALRSLHNSIFGNLKQTLGQITLPLNQWPELALLTLQSEAAIEELIRRRKASASMRFTDEEPIFDIDSDAARAYAAELMAGFDSQPFDKYSRFHNIILITQAIRNYTIEGSETFISKALEDVHQFAPNEDDALQRKFLRARLLHSAIDSRIPDLQQLAVDSLIERPEIFQMLAAIFYKAKQREALSAFVERLPHSFLSQQMAILLDPEKELHPYTLFLASSAPNTLPDILKITAPFYDPKINYAIEDLKYAKSWYRESNNIPVPTWRQNRDQIPKKFFLEVLPKHNKAGMEILTNLGGIDLYRTHAIQGLARCQEDRNLLADRIRKLGRPRDQDFRENDYDVALWVLTEEGDSKAMEQWMKYPPNHVASSIFDRVPYMNQKRLIDLAQRRHEIGIYPYNSLKIVEGLKTHRDQKTWSLIWQIWTDFDSPKNNVYFARIFNEAANRHFGMRKQEMLNWLNTLPDH